MRLTVSIEPETAAGLQELARREERDPRRQAGMLLARAVREERKRSARRERISETQEQASR